MLRRAWSEWILELALSVRGGRGTTDGRRAGSSHASLDLKDEKSEGRMENDEVRLAFGEGLAAPRAKPGV